MTNERSLKHPDSSSVVSESSNGDPPIDSSNKEKSRVYLFLFVVAVIVPALDVSTKTLVANYFEGLTGKASRETVIVEGFLSFLNAYPRGGAWGLLDGEETVRRPFVVVVTIVSILFIVAFYWVLARTRVWAWRAFKWGPALVFGGTLGNLIDRIRFGHVVDFVDFHVMSSGRVRHWPTFNLADVAITIGVAITVVGILKALTSFVSGRKGSSPNPKA